MAASQLVGSRVVALQIVRMGIFSPGCASPTRLRARMRTAGGVPVALAAFESTVPGCGYAPHQTTRGRPRFAADRFHSEEPVTAACAWNASGKCTLLPFLWPS
jgi:hypothetical protein